MNSSRGARRGLTARALRLWLHGSMGWAVAVSAPQAAGAQSGSAQAASASFWVEREGDTLRATVDLRPLCEADVRRRLGSGPSADLKLGLALREHGTEVVRGRIVRVASVRWDAFRDRLLGSVADPVAGDAAFLTFTKKLSAVDFKSNWHVCPSGV